MATDPRFLPLRVPSGYTPILTPDHVMAFAQQHGSKRVEHVRMLLDVWFGDGLKWGYNPDILAGQSCLETDTWRSPQWVDNLNPGGIGVTDQFDFGLLWKSGTDSGRAMLVHFMAYAKGHDNRMAPWIDLDPRFVSVHKAGWASIARFLSHLSGKWATDLLYGQKVAGRIDDMAKAIVAPPPEPSIPAGIISVATGNHHARHPQSRIQHVVHHITDDLNVNNVLSWFKNPASGASSHFVVDRTINPSTGKGTIYQCVSTLRSAWTNGKVDKPRRDIPLLNTAVDQTYYGGGPTNMNDWCVTIEYVGTPAVPPTEAQYNAGIEIADYVCDKYGVSPHRYGQLRHADIDSVDRPYCPGPSFDLAKVIIALGGDPAKLVA